MKIVKIILGVLAVLSIALLFGLFWFERENPMTILAVGRVPYEIITLVCLVLPPVALVAICIITMVEKFRSGAKGKLLMATGVVIFGAVSAFMGIVAYRLTDEGSLIKVLESPDGQHMIYYTDINLGYADLKIPGFRALQRTGIFTYKKQMVASVFEMENIVWEDDGYYVYRDEFFIDKFEYSIYGK